MNTTLLIEQLTVAVIVSAVVVPTVQRVKGWFPSAIWVEAFSALIAVVLGFIMARYYAGYDLSASAWVGFYSLIGAETIYRLVAEKVKTYTQIKEQAATIPELSNVDLSKETEYLLKAGE